MSRVKTEHRIVNEGLTGRIIARRFLRRVLGNPKKRERDKAEILQEMFFKGIEMGKKVENLRIRYCTAAMEYGAEYIVEATDAETVAPVLCSDPMSDGPLADPCAGIDAHGGSDYPDADAIPR